MPVRALLALVTAGLTALVVITVVSIDADSDFRPTTSATGFAGAIRPSGIPVVELTGLRDQAGQRVLLSELRGTPVVVTFLYTRCEDTCPTTAQQIRAALDDLGRDVPVLAISVDPANDTPERARRFLLRNRVIGRMRFLLGDRASLARQWRAYGIGPQTDTLEHTGAVVVLDAKGRQRIGFPADRLTPRGLAGDLQTLGGEADRRSRDDRASS